MHVIGPGFDISPWVVALLDTWNTPIKLDPRWHGGDCYGREESVEDVAQPLKMVTLTARSWGWAKRTFGYQPADAARPPAADLESQFQVEAALNAAGAARASVVDANHMLYMSKTNQLYRLTDQEVAGIGRRVRTGQWWRGGPAARGPQDDPAWADWSLAQLEAASLRDGLCINPVVHAELSIAFLRIEELEHVLREARLTLEPIPREALFLAGKAFMRYRRQRGVKTGVLPDFFIGSHAAVTGWPLLTRDGRRYRDYFPGVELISPA